MPANTLLIIGDSAQGYVWPWYYKYPILGMVPFPATFLGSGFAYNAKASGGMSNAKVVDYATGGTLASLVVSGASYVLLAIGRVDAFAWTSQADADTTIAAYLDFIDDVLVTAKGYKHSQIILWLPYCTSETNYETGYVINYSGGEFGKGVVGIAGANMNSKLEVWHDLMTIEATDRGMPIADMFNYSRSVGADEFTALYLYNPLTSLDSGIDPAVLALYDDAPNGDGGHPILNVDSYFQEHRNTILAALENS